MKFSKEFLRETLGDKNDVKNEIVDQGRWSTTHERVFRHEDKFYASCYSHGSTEVQGEEPYEFDGDMIECVEVEPVEKVVIVYEPVIAKKEATDA